MIKKLLLAGLAMFIVSAILVLRPVPIVYEDQAIVEVGVLERFYLGGPNDVCFRLKNNNRRFYINRGLEAGLDMAELKTNYVDKEVIVKYPKYWTPLDWNNEVKHVSKLQYKEEVIFDEFLKREMKK